MQHIVVQATYRRRQVRSIPIRRSRSCCRKRLLRWVMYARTVSACPHDMALRADRALPCFVKLDAGTRGAHPRTDGSCRPTASTKPQCWRVSASARCSGSWFPHSNRRRRRTGNGLSATDNFTDPTWLQLPSRFAQSRRHIPIEPTTPGAFWPNPNIRTAPRPPLPPLNITQGSLLSSPYPA